MKVLFIATVREFYRQRAGMFFVLIAILFGFLSGREHKAFASFFLTDRFGLVYLFAIWLMYTLFCGHFLLNLWRQADYYFVFQSRLWSARQRFGRFSLLALGFLQPPIYYGIFMYFVALQEGILHRFWPALFFYIFLTLILAGCAEWRVHHPVLLVEKRQTTGFLKIPRPVSWIYWSIEFLFREKGITLLICKTGAALIFVGTLIYYSSDVYDIRLPAIGLSLGYLLNIGLSYELFRWERGVWLWSMSLPISTMTRFLRLLTIHAILLLPETFMLLRDPVLSVWEGVQLYGLGLAVLMLFHTYLYSKNGLLENYLQPVLWSFVGLTLLVLYKTPILLLTLLSLLYALFQYKKWHTGSVSS